MYSANVEQHSSVVDWCTVQCRAVQLNVVCFLNVQCCAKCTADEQKPSNILCPLLATALHCAQYSAVHSAKCSAVHSTVQWTVYSAVLYSAVHSTVHSAKCSAVLYSAVHSDKCSAVELTVNQ